MGEKLEEINEKEQRDDDFLKSWRENRLGVSGRKDKPMPCGKESLD